MQTDWKTRRIEAVARAVARVRYPLAAEPAPQQADYDEARRFLAMLDAELDFTGAQVPAWPDALAAHERETVGDC